MRTNIYVIIVYIVTVRHACVNKINVLRSSKHHCCTKCMYEPYIICNYDFMLPYWSPLRSIININSEPIYHPLTSPQPPGSCLQHHSPICKSQPWVRLCTKLKVISENSDYDISGSHLEFFVPVWSSKSHEISGKKPLEHWRPLPLLLLCWPTEFWPKVWPNTYLGTNHQCERVDYNLIIGFSLSVFGGCRCLMLLLR